MLDSTHDLGAPSLSLDPQRREGLATWEGLHVEFAYTIGGTVRSMTLHDPAGSLRIVAGLAAIEREPLLARIAELIALTGKLR